MAPTYHRSEQLALIVIIPPTAPPFHAFLPLASTALGLGRTCCKSDDAANSGTACRPAAATEYASNYGAADGTLNTAGKWISFGTIVTQGDACQQYERKRNGLMVHQLAVAEACP